MHERGMRMVSAEEMKKSARVLFTSHIEHYTVGLTRELAKLFELTVLAYKPMHVDVKVLPNYIFPPKVRGVSRMILLRAANNLFNVLHLNYAFEAVALSSMDNILVTSHGFPFPGLDPEELEGHLREIKGFEIIRDSGVPVVAISNYTAEKLRTLYGIRVVDVIYHGLLPAFLSTQTRDYPFMHKLLLVSRLNLFKEPLLFFRALQKLDKPPGLKVLVRGEGPLAPQVKSFARKFQYIQVHFVRRLPFKALPLLYKAATIYIHTCSREPFGMSVLEAMGSALPVIVPRSGGAFEVAGNAALAFEAGSEEDLVDKLEAVLQDPTLYEKLSAASLARATRFKWSEAALKYAKLYAKVYKG
ncbi:MAG: glycosyltransferase family 4 protein [Infirmifilum sp.]